MAIDEGSIAGAAPIVIQVLANDVGEGLRVTAVSQPAHGTAVITDIDQTITYTPQNGYLGPDSFEYTAADATSQAETALVEIDVRMPMISIVGNPWSAITTTPAVIPVLDNDIGIGLEVVAVTDPPHGTASISGGTLNAAMPQVIAQGSNRLAVCFLAGSDDVEVGAATGATGGTWVERHQRLSGSGADSVVTLQTAAMDSGGIISGGASTLAAAANWVTRAFALVPAVEGVTPSFIGLGAVGSQVLSPLSPTYPAVVAGDLLLLHMVVRAVNGAVTTPNGFTLLWGPNDASNKTIRSFVYGRIATGTETGTVSVAFTGSTTGVHGCATIYRFSGAQALLAFEGEGTTSGGGGPTVTYTADAGYTGPDSFSYTAQDDYGQIGSATVSVQVLASAPTVLAVDDNAAAIAGVARTISPLANDRPSTGIITNLTTTAATNGTAQRTTDNKQIIYTANPGFSGTATFDYVMNDGGANTDTGTVTVTVSAPEAIAIEDHFDATAGVSQDLPVLTNDVGSQNLTITTVTTPDHGGTASPKAPDNKLITYTPAATGPETFSYTVSDGLGHTSTALVTVEVSPPNIHASPDSYGATAGLMKTLTPLDNDDPDTGIHISNVGPAVSNAQITRISGPKGADTQLNYTAPPTFSGTDEFDYTISDAAGNLSTSTISVSVSKIAFTPTRDVVTTQQDTALVISPLSNDGGSNTVMVAIGDTDWVRSAIVLNDDTAPPPVVARNDGPGPEWTATAGVAKELDVLANDTGGTAGAMIIKSGSITAFSRGGNGTRTGDFKRILYTPPATAGIETFTYIATDNTTDSSPATVSIDVALAPPVVKANPDPNPGGPALIATVGVTLPIDVLANDTPTGLRISAVQNPTQRGQAVINASGNRIDYLGNSVGQDVFNYTASDGLTPPHTSVASVTLTVQAAPTSVTARDDSFTAVQGTPTLLSVLANDDGSNLIVKAASFTNFSNGGIANRATSNTQAHYTSAANFIGTETFKYIATDGTNEDDAVVSVKVTAKSSTVSPTIGLTRVGAKRVTPTTAQLKNIQTNNADAAVQGLNTTAHQNNDNCTLDLRDRKFYHHSATRWTGDANQPRRKFPITLSGSAIRSGLCVYGAEFIGEQADTAPFAELRYHAATGLDLIADDDAALFQQLTATNAIFYVENCIFRKGFDGIPTTGPTGATGKNRFIIRECYAEKQRNQFIQNDTLQLLEVYGCLIDSCNLFLSTRPLTNPTTGLRDASPPDYSVVANRIKLRQVLARLRGQYVTNLGGTDVFQPFSKRTQQWKDDNSLVTTPFTTTTAAGYGHREPFRGINIEASATGAVPWVDAEDCIFAFESAGIYSGPVRMPPGTYVNCYLCFLPDLSSGATNPSRAAFYLDPTGGPRAGLTVLWGSEARTKWFDSRSDWINARGGFTNANGLQDFPFAHLS